MLFYICYTLWGGDDLTVSSIKKIKNGDLDIAEEIVSENYDAIYKYCYWKIGNSVEAQDITQEVSWIL